jgi:hypothetical protein
MPFDVAKMGPVFKFIDNQFVASTRVVRGCSFLIQRVYGRGSWNREKSPDRSKHEKMQKMLNQPFFATLKLFY